VTAELAPLLERHDGGHACFGPNGVAHYGGVGGRCDARILLDLLTAAAEALEALSDAIADQAAVGSDGLFSPTAELDARQAYLAALRAARRLLADLAPLRGRK
jgi:hypothetical protein